MKSECLKSNVVHSVQHTMGQTERMIVYEIYQEYLEWLCFTQVISAAILHYNLSNTLMQAILRLECVPHNRKTSSAS